MNAVGGPAREGGHCRPETLEGHATRPKAAACTGGGPREPPVPYENVILTILGENSNHINRTEHHEYRFDWLDQFLSSLVYSKSPLSNNNSYQKCSYFGTICFVWRQNSEVTMFIIMPSCLCIYM